MANGGYAPLLYGIGGQERAGAFPVTSNTLPGWLPAPEQIGLDHFKTVGWFGNACPVG